MAFAKSLADGHIKLAVLTSAPSNPLAPTTTELNAGIDASALILASDFVFGMGDSDKVQEKSLVDVNNVNALGASNPTAGLTIFRQYTVGTGVPDPTGDALFTALKVKGTTVYVYRRKNGKLATAAWASTDEIRGMQCLTDEVQELEGGGGYIKNRVPLEPQTNYGLVAVA